MVQDLLRLATSEATGSAAADAWLMVTALATNPCRDNAVGARLDGVICVQGQLLRQYNPERERRTALAQLPAAIFRGHMSAVVKRACCISLLS